MKIINRNDFWSKWEVKAGNKSKNMEMDKSIKSVIEQLQKTNERKFKIISYRISDKKNILTQKAVMSKVVSFQRKNQ